MPDLHFFSIGDNLNDTGHYGFVKKTTLTALR